MEPARCVGMADLICVTAFMDFQIPRKLKSALHAKRSELIATPVASTGSQVVPARRPIPTNKNDSCLI